MDPSYPVAYTMFLEYVIMKRDDARRRTLEETLIISDPKIMVGKPVIKGTRITVEHILTELANGLTVEQILTEYPHLTRQGIEAALRFAAESVRVDFVHPIDKVSA